MKKKESRILSLIEQQVVGSAKEYVASKVKKQILKVGEVSVLVILGFILISMGISYLIGYYFPITNNGINFLLFGAILLIVGIIRSK